MTRVSILDISICPQSIICFLPTFISGIMLIRGLVAGGLKIVTFTRYMRVAGVVFVSGLLSHVNQGVADDGQPGV